MVNRDEPLEFKNWLNLCEVGTTTADVATVPMPAIGGGKPIRRDNPGSLKYQKKSKLD